RAGPRRDPRAPSFQRHPPSVAVSARRPRPRSLRGRRPPRPLRSARPPPPILRRRPLRAQRPPSRQTSKAGSMGPAVLSLQNRFTALGYWLGPPDGTFGDSTEQAVVAFQRAAVG